MGRAQTHKSGGTDYFYPQRADHPHIQLCKGCPEHLGPVYHRMPKSAQHANIRQNPNARDISAAELEDAHSDWYVEEKGSPNLDWEGHQVEEKLDCTCGICMAQLAGADLALPTVTAEDEEPFPSLMIRERPTRPKGVAKAFEVVPPLPQVIALDDEDETRPAAEYNDTPLETDGWEEVDDGRNEITDNLSKTLANKRYADAVKGTG